MHTKKNEDENSMALIAPKDSRKGTFLVSNRMLKED